MGNLGDKDESDYTSDEDTTDERSNSSSSDRAIQNLNAENKSKAALPKESFTEHNRFDKLKNPESERPIELSWLQQNKKHDNYNRVSQSHDHEHSENQRNHPNHLHDYHRRHPHQQQHQHQHHHHPHHEHHVHKHKKMIAINRWPKLDDHEAEKQTAKTFIEEYIHP